MWGMVEAQRKKSWRNLKFNQRCGLTTKNHRSLGRASPSFACSPMFRYLCCLIKEKAEVSRHASPKTRFFAIQTGGKQQRIVA